MKTFDTTRIAGLNGVINMEDTDILAAVFKNLAVGVVVCDTKGHFVFFSPEAERILGGNAIRAPSAHWSPMYGCYQPDMVTPYPLEKLPLARALRGEQALHELIFLKNLQRPAGIWIDASGSPLRDIKGNLCGGLVVFSDVSVPESLLRHEAVLQTYLTSARSARDPVDDRQDLVSERFARFRTMYRQLVRAVEQTADGILITDNRGLIEYVNPAFEKITGYSVDDVLGRKPNVLKSGQHGFEFYRDLWSKLISDDVFHGTTINRKKSGELFWSALTITPIKDEAGITTHFVSVMKDVTALRKKQELEFHMAMARELQQRHYNTTASLPGFDIAAAAFPADETGGDYFDFIPQRDGSLYIAVADIAGHGFGSAFVMAEVRASLRAYATVLPDISSVLKCVHRSLATTLSGNRFVTMFLGRIDPRKRSLEYASAGHGLGYVLHHSGEIKAVLASTAAPLGLPLKYFADEEFNPVWVSPLERGDTILLLTDGITESMNMDDAEFGAERALEFIRCRRMSTASELARGLYLAVRRFAGNAPQLDDILSVICKVQ